MGILQAWHSLFQGQNCWFENKENSISQQCEIITSPLLTSSSGYECITLSAEFIEPHIRIDIEFTRLQKFHSSLHIRSKFFLQPCLQEKKRECGIQEKVCGLCNPFMLYVFYGSYLEIIWQFNHYVTFYLFVWEIAHLHLF